MTRLLLATVAAATLAFGAQAQAPDRQPPNPDTDHDGKVTLAEFKASQAERQARMFARMDTNRDGKISQAEMDASRKRLEAAGRSPPPGARPGGPAGGFLARFDTNKDGFVSKAEMGAMTEQRFRMADTNNDGWLSKGELLMMRNRMRGPGSE